MGLKTYHAKRNFRKTPEPRGRQAAERGTLRFVVQKHDATRLHYDFRLELDGVMKSWAVPKGPSLNPRDKRLAMMVEDHPLDYRTFEGVIPPGNYGAGTVMVWDEGTYKPAHATVGENAPSVLREGLKRGRLSVILEGQKLKGEFSLLKLNRGKENAWLLIKKADEWASDADVTEENQSAASGRTLEEIAQDKRVRVGRSRTGVWKAVKRRRRPAHRGGRPGRTDAAPHQADARHVRPGAVRPCPAGSTS